MKANPTKRRFQQKFGTFSSGGLLLYFSSKKKKTTAACFGFVRAAGGSAEIGPGTHSLAAPA